MKTKEKKLSFIANRLFRDPKKVALWFDTPSPFFDNKKPLDYLKSNPKQEGLVTMELYMSSIQDEYRPVVEDYEHRVLRITDVANAVFEDRKNAKEWLNSDRIRALGCHKPLDLLQTEAGTRRVEHSLAAIVYGFCA